MYYTTGAEVHPSFVLGSFNKFTFTMYQLPQLGLVVVKSSDYIRQP